MSASLKAQEEALSAVQSIKEQAEQQKKMMSSQVEELQEVRWSHTQSHTQ